MVSHGSVNDDTAWYMREGGFGIGGSNFGGGAIRFSSIPTGGDASQGDTLYHDGDHYTRLGKGTAGQILTMNAGATAPEWAAAGGGGEANENSFKTIEVDGQSDVVADSDDDTLTLVAGSNMTITTSEDAITFIATATGGGGGGFTLPFYTAAGALDTIMPNSEYAFYKADGTLDTITIISGLFPFYKADGTLDNIRVS